MKKLLSLFGLLGLLAFVSTPTYAEDYYVEPAYSDYDYSDSWAYPDDWDSDDWIGSGGWVSSSSTSGYGSIWMNRLWLLAIIWGISFIYLILGYLVFIYANLLPISQWEIYRKAGKKGWAFLIPFWWTMVYSEIAWMNKWRWLLPWILAIIPIFWTGAMAWWSAIRRVLGLLVIVLFIATLIWLIIANYRTARRFGWGKFASVLHAILILCRVTIPVLWLWKYRYLPNVEEKPENVVEA